MENALHEKGAGVESKTKYFNTLATQKNHIPSDPLSEVLSRLDKVKRVAEGKYSACCCCHDDKKPSLVITKKPDGVILIHCFGCGASGLDVCQALGIDTSTLFPPSDNPKYTKQSRIGFSAWQLLHALKTDLVRLLIISNDLKKIDALSSDDRQFIFEVVLRLNDGMAYMEGAR